MKKTLILFFLIGFLQMVVFAQAANYSSCPKFYVDEPSTVPKPNENLRFKVVFENNFNTSNLKFHWTISDGTIISGQGTSSIIVKQKDNITVTVQLKGLPPNCADTASGTLYLDPSPTALSDKYSKISFKEEIEKLNKFAAQLQNDPTAVAFVTKSFTRNVSKKAAYLDLLRILRYLENHSIARERIIFGATYDKKELTTLWLVPAGAERPEFKDEILNAQQLEEKLNRRKP